MCEIKSPPETPSKNGKSISDRDPTQPVFLSRPPNVPITSTVNMPKTDDFRNLAACQTSRRQLREAASFNHALQRTRPSRSGCNPRVSWAGSLSLGRSSEVREHVRADGGGRWIPGRRKMGKKIEGKTMDVIGEGAGRRVAVCRMLVCSGHDYFALHLLASSVVGPGPGGRTGRRVVSWGRRTTNQAAQRRRVKPLRLLPCRLSDAAPRWPWRSPKEA